MLLTLKEIRERVEVVLGLASGQLNTSVLDGYIDQVYRTWLPTTLWPPELVNHFTMDTVADTGEYGLDRDILAVTGPIYRDGVPIRLTFNHEDFFSITPDRYAEQHRQPEIVLVFSSQIWLYPIPDDVYQIKATALARPAELVNDSDEVFNPSWALPIVYGAAALYTYDVGDLQQYQAHTTMYDSAVLVARREQLTRMTGQRAKPHW